MKPTAEDDRVLIARIRRGEASAWSDLINAYEGRLMAFVDSRLANKSASEDIVQEAFVGFLNSLPNFDGERSLESYLFSICAYKLTDHLRREGRRPAIPMYSANSRGDGEGSWDLTGAARHASSIARSGERKQLEERALVEAIAEQVDKWRLKKDWLKLQCIELLIVQGRSNKQVANYLKISEQQVANFKFDFLSRLRTLVKRQGLAQDVFPELYHE